MPRDTGRVLPPVLVVGMHRSGTTLLARLLEEVGLFQGWRLAANREASFFNKLNSWLLASSGGRWDTPESVDYLLDDDQGRALASDYLRDRLSSPAALEFLGPLRYLRHGSVFGIREPWGWKDPRTTVVLPFWLELFPEARVIHLVRHGVDVADSLYRRQLRGREQARRNYRRYRPLSRLRAKKGWFGTSPRLVDRRQAFRLWETYVASATRFTAGLGERLLELRFESLLAEPAELERVYEFSRLRAAPRSGALRAALRPERAFAFRHSADLVELWEEVRESRWMRRLGYDSLSGETR